MQNSIVLASVLNGMIGFLQLVLDGLCDSPEEQRDFLKQALQCSRHLLGLINDVLDIAKIEAGKLTLEIDRIDIGGLFDEVYTLAHVQAAQKGLRLTFEPPEEQHLGVRGRGLEVEGDELLVQPEVLADREALDLRVEPRPAFVPELHSSTL